MTKEEFFKPDHRRMIEKVKMPISAADFNYESPIAIDEIVENIAEESSKEIDKLTYKAIMQVGVRVDKEELIKALAYDRDQYTKGFNDGFEAGKKARWTKVEDGLPKEDDTVYGVTSTGDLVKAYIWDDCGETKWYADGCYDACIVKWMPMPEEE